MTNFGLMKSFCLSFTYFFVLEHLFGCIIIIFSLALISDPTIRILFYSYFLKLIEITLLMWSTLGLKIKVWVWHIDFFVYNMPTRIVCVCLGRNSVALRHDLRQQLSQQDVLRDLLDINIVLPARAFHLLVAFTSTHSQRIAYVAGCCKDRDAKATPRKEINLAARRLWQW